MRIFRHYQDLPREVRGSCLALGNFDGVHLGHQAVIRRAGEAARAEGLPFAVLTFEPHPRQFFEPSAPPFRLTPFRLKAHYIEEMDVDVLFAIHFDRELVNFQAEEFIRRVLVDGLGVRHVVVGYDFVFGKGRSGNAALLEAAKASHGFEVTTMTPVAAPNGEVYSSTRAREYLRMGDVTRAAGILGRWWEVEGRIERGDARGRTLGFPTANIVLGDILRPARGVYAVRAGVDQGRETEWLHGVANFGLRPTIGTAHEVFEVHLFDFADEIYGAHLRVQLVEFLRGEARFEGLAALRAQIAKDCARARAVLARRAAEGTGPVLDQSDVIL